MLDRSDGVFPPEVQAGALDRMAEVQREIISRASHPTGVALVSDDIAVFIDPDDLTITITGHGSAIPMTYEDARNVATTITNLLATLDPEPDRPGGLDRPLPLPRKSQESVTAHVATLGVQPGTITDPCEVP